MAEDHRGITREELKELLEEELTRQRKEIFRHMGEAVGYDLGDPDEQKSLRKDLWMVRRTRLRSEQFTSTGQKVFFVFFWGSLLSAIVAGAFAILKEKLGI